MLVEQAAAPDRAIAVGKYSFQLPNGGVVWATEDPNLGAPVLNAAAPAYAAFDGTRIVKPLHFIVYSNYPAFIKRAEVLVFKATDADMIAPIARIDVPLGAVSEVDWDGGVPADVGLKLGDELIYVVRAYGANDQYDETFPRRFQLVTPAEQERGTQLLRANTEKQVGLALSDEEAIRRSLTQGVFGADGLARQNISINGSRIRIQGRNIGSGVGVKINGQTHPVDQEGKLLAEYLVPLGKHDFALNLTAPRGAKIEETMTVDVTGRYMFMVGIADLTASTGGVSGSVEPLAEADRFDKDFLVDGRLAFYLKGKIKGKYLITAQMDTRERELKNLFNGFFRADPQDVFRRLDPDAYYPVYGDDSTTYRDIDTQGRLYVRVDWDKNTVLFGNFETGITGTEYAQYSRALYGAAGSLRSARTTKYGEPGTEVRAFGSEAQTGPGHDEFIGTGGSLYYLKRTDLLPGSDRVVIEVRDPTTGRVENRAELLRGADYEIDELQGRILLTKPLLQFSSERETSITNTAPLDGLAQYLLVDYEYVPRGISADNLAMGVRAKHWLGDHVGVGVTYVDENRSGDDYSIKGADVTLRAGKGTYVKVEHSRTNATSASVFYSDNGGLSFVERNDALARRRGDATAVEARVNLRELGATSRDWSAAAWWRDVDAGHSISRFDIAQAVQEYGAEIQGEPTANTKLFARANRAERGAETLTQAQLTAEWNITDRNALTGEIRMLDEKRPSGDATGTLAALRYTHRIGTALDLYATGQLTLDEDGGAYEDNNALTLGAKYNFANLSTVGAEATTGDRGDAARVTAEYRLTPDHTVYGAYTLSTDRTGYDPMFNNRAASGWTLGQRWRLSNQVSMFNETQSLRGSGRESGIAHTFGMDFYPSVGWNLGFTLQSAKLRRDDPASVLDQVNRRAVSLNGGYTNADTQWQSKVEWRRDTGAEQRTQWVTTNRFGHKFNESFRVAGRLNYSDTDDKLNPLADAKFVEANAGFALRPWNTTRWALFGKYSYFYDVSSLPQIGDNVAFYDQKSRIASLEGIYDADRNWEFAGKLMRRDGDVRFGRLQGQWADSGTTFAAGQVRYELGSAWHALAEYRILDVDNGGTRHGALVGIDRDVGKYLRLGVGYNFTDFSDNLTDFEYDNRGLFLNLVGRF